MAGLPPGIKNWHWRTKGVEPWAKDWFHQQIDGLSHEGVSLKLKDCEGDCELGMRKSKLVTIYDLKLTMEWTAQTADGETVNGSLTAVEVAHDMDEDEYQFTSSLDSASSKEADAFHKTAKRSLADKLRPIFAKFPKALVDTHGKDLLTDAANDGSAQTSGASTPAATSGSKSTPTVPSAATVSAGTNKAPFNTSVVKASGDFASDAEGLFDVLTNEQRIPMWSRNPAHFKLDVGSEVDLFSGNIKGKIIKVDKPTFFSMTWRAPTWPEGYFGNLEVKLTQGSNSTTIDLRLEGVPVGKEEETERNLNGYYLNSLRAIGSVYTPPRPPPLLVPASSSLSSSKSERSYNRARTQKKPRTPVEPPSKWLYAANIGVAAISFGVVAALGAAIWYGPSGRGGTST
ncbi:Co-chaperone [Microbotryomycetes sp. JL221]|nr:Co-chaperone [Microbotryomycetes sp. JL221]